MRIIQISDSHIALDTPSRLQDLKNCVNAVNAEAPDRVIHTGDISHNGLAEEYQAAREILDQLTAPYFVLIGNKDKRDRVREAFQDHEYLQQEHGFIQYALDDLSTRLIVLDTVREATSKGELCERRLQELESMLHDSGDKPAVIFMHHSPYVVEEIPDPQQFHDWEQVDALGALLSRHQNVKQIYCGHVHRNVRGSIADIPIDVLSCMATDLRKGKLNESDKQRPMFTIIEL